MGRRVQPQVTCVNLTAGAAQPRSEAAAKWNCRKVELPHRGAWTGDGVASPVLSVDGEVIDGDHISPAREKSE